MLELYSTTTKVTYMRAAYELLGIITYPLRYISYRIARFSLDFQIRSALRTTLQTQIHENKFVIEPSQKLFKLLQLAESSTSDSAATYKKLMAYRFFNNMSLLDYLNSAQSNNIHASQTQLFNIAILYQTQKVMDASQPHEASLTLGQRILRWFLKSSFGEKRIHFDTEGFTENDLLKLQSTEKQNKLDTEKYSPKEMLTTRYIEDALKQPEAVDIDALSAIHSASLTTPAIVLEMDLNRNLNADQVVIIDTQQGQDIVLTRDQSLARQNDIDLDLLINVDLTQNISIDTVRKMLCERRFYRTNRWISTIQYAISTKKTLIVSKQALDVLCQYGGDYICTVGTIDLETLPVGFFLENPENVLEARLGYCEQLRLKQLENPEIAAVRFDMVGNQGQSAIEREFEFDSNQLSKLSSRSVISILDNKGIEISESNARFFYLLDQSKLFFGNAMFMMNHLTYKALLKILNDSSSTNDKIKYLLDFITIMNNKTVIFDGININLFQVFSQYYFCYLTNSQTFNSVESQDYLGKLANASDQEMRIFYLLSRSAASPSRYNGNFLQTARRTFYFSGFLLDHQITLPTQLPNPIVDGVFAQPETLMSCLTTVQNQYPNLLSWMGQHMHVMPVNLTRSKQLLKAGYSFVHQAMMLEHHGPQVESLYLLGNVDNAFPVDFTAYNSSSASIKRAAFLRYLACNVQCDQVVNMIQKWETLVGSLDAEIDQSKFNRSWNQLVQQVEQLPKRTQRSEGQYAANKQPINCEYDERDIENFLKQLAISQDFKDNLSSIIGAVNSHAKLYLDLDDLTRDTIKDELGKINSSGQPPDEILAKRICLIREAYFRMTRKWLRLEQLVAVILRTNPSMCLQIDTGEGKTTIIGCTALLKALSDKKVDVLTHNQAFAQDGAEELAKLANLFGMSVAVQTSPQQTPPERIDILYVDIATAVLSDLFKQVSSTQDTGRHAQDALLDEADNIILDINFGTTMQISESSNQEANNELVEWISYLNSNVRTDEQELTLEYFKTKYINCNWEQHQFNFWYAAAKTAANLHKDIDYVVQADRDHHDRLAVYIVHKTTTGNVDRESKWGNGVHTCVSAWEQKQASSIYIPDISKVQKKETVIEYLKAHYTELTLYSGTLGNTQAINWMKTEFDSEVVVFPRAKRPKTNDIEWPKGYGGFPIYSRNFLFPPRILNDNDKHFKCILDALKQVQAQDKSCLVFWNTIDECNLFANYLREQGISDAYIQIFDDARDAQSSVADQTRPDPETIIGRARSPQMITLGTAVAGRGVNFRDVQYAIVAKPSSTRGTMQKIGRVGRDGDLGIVYEIYNLCDLSVNPNASPINTCDFRAIIRCTEDLKEPKLGC